MVVLLCCVQLDLRLGLSLSPFSHSQPEAPRRSRSAPSNPLTYQGYLQRIQKRSHCYNISQTKALTPPALLLNAARLRKASTGGVGESCSARNTTRVSNPLDAELQSLSRKSLPRCRLVDITSYLPWLDSDLGDDFRLRSMSGGLRRGL